uniref:BLNK n=1 Tax=Sphenodon punctatus TaxID=8508 RepID=A0A8D0H5S6_SPHPU
MVHDIKKNETGIMSKFKKFQSGQIASICKTGKDTWDRLTTKPPPNVPKRDYDSEHAEDDDQWSDDFEESDYENPDEHSDSEMYVVPTEENCDDSYEPPPSAQEKKKIPSAFPFPTGEYADNRSNHQQPPPGAKLLPTVPSQPLPKPKKPASLLSQSAALKPRALAKPKACMEDEADYVVPVDDEDDNYIEPTEESPPQPKKPPMVNRSTKPTIKTDPPSSTKLPPAPVSPSILEVYEVPEEEEKSSPPTSRTKPLLLKPVQSTGAHSQLQSTAKESPKLDSTRNVLPLPRNHPQPKADHNEGETRNNDTNPSSGGVQESRFPSVAMPLPLPRAIKKTPNPIKSPKPSLPHRDHLSINEEKPTPTERRRGSSQELPLPPLPPTGQRLLPQKPPVLPKPPDTMNRSSGTPRNSISTSSTAEDQDAGVYSKAWYAGSCDRKTAEDALYKSNKVKQSRMGNKELSQENLGHKRTG